jgi:hypothetical protein
MKQTHDPLLRPLGVERVGEEGKSGAARRGSAFGDDVLNEAAVLGRVGEWLALVDEAGREVANKLRRDHATAKKEVELVGEAGREDLVQVRGDVGGRDHLAGRRDDEGERKAVAIGGEHKRVLDG